MITIASGRKQARCAAVLLLAMLGGLLVMIMDARGVDDVRSTGRAGPIVPPPTSSLGPTLTLNVYEGQPGAEVHAEGSGYSGECSYGDSEDDDGQADHLDPASYRFNLAWDGKQLAAADSERGDGFSTDFLVPPKITESGGATGTAGKHQIVAKCGAEESPPVIFTIPPTPTLRLIPGTGRSGALFTVEGTGYSNCNYDCVEGGQSPQVQVTWDTNQVIATAVMRNDGTFTAENVPVPPAAVQGNHQVVGKFGTESAAATFVVRPSPTVTLYPGNGLAGKPFRVQGDGYSPCVEGCPPVEVFWGANNDKIGTGSMTSDGRFSVNVNVPQTASPGNHQVVARSGSESAEQTFSVVPPPVLSLRPSQGRPGMALTVEGSGYGRCTGTCSYVSGETQVEVIWEATNEVLATPVMRSDGTFLTTDARVPQTAVPGNRYRVIGQFGAERATAVFVVEPLPVDSSVLDLTLIPNMGKPGESFVVEGDGYNKCPDSGGRGVNIYDRNIQGGDGFGLELGRNVPISDEGSISRSVQMPVTAQAGNHEISVRCFGGADYASEIFTVTGSTPRPDGQTPGLPLPEFPLPPVPTDPGPTDPGPTDPGPTGPGPTDPDPNDPGPTVSPDPTIPPDPSGSYDEKRDRAYLATQVFSPVDVFNNPFQLLLSVLLVVLLVLVVAFPADLFNSTFENNREEIHGWFGWISRLRWPNLPSWVHLIIFGLVAAALMMIVVPTVGLHKATLTQVVGFLLAIPLVAVVLEMPRGWYFRRQNRVLARYLPPAQWHAAQWRVLPSALIVALFLAVLSRLADFHPPYIYGLMAVYIGADLALGNRNLDEHKGRGTLLGVLLLFVCSIIAWLCWIPVDRIIDGGQPGFGWLILDATLATFFLLGLETVVFGMIPLAFLKGKDILQWRRTIWVATFVPIAYVFVNIQYVVRETEALTLVQMVKVVALFLAFGIFSVLFWGYFHPRVRGFFSRLARQ